MATEHWSSQEVQTLLSIIGEEEIQRELDGAVRNEKTFRVVSERMLSHGFTRTPRQCRTKCKKLRCDYKKVKDHNSRSGVKRKNWRWFDAMDRIYGHRPLSQGRECGLDSAAGLLESLVEGDGVPVSPSGEELTSFGPTDVDERCGTTALATMASSASTSSPVSPSPSQGRESPAVLSRSTQQRSARRKREHQRDLTVLLTEILASDEREAQLSRELQRQHLERRERARQEEQRARQEERRSQQEERRVRQEEWQEERRVRQEEWQEERRGRQEELRQLAEQSQVFNETFLQGVALLAQALRTQRDTEPTE